MSESPTSEDKSPRPSTSGSDTGSIQANYFVEGTSQAGDDSIPTTQSATAENVESSNSEDHPPENPAGDTHIHHHHHYHGPINTNVFSTGPNAYIDKSGATNIVGAVTSEEGEEPKIDRAETEAEDPVGTKSAVGGTTDSKDESPSTSVQSLGEEIHRGSVQANDFVKGEGNDAEQLVRSTPSTSTQRPERRISTVSINTNVLSTGPNANIDKSGSTNIVGAVTSEEGQEPNTDRMKTKAEESVGTKYAVGGTTDSKDESPSTSVRSLGEEIHRHPVGTKYAVGGTTDSKDELPSTSVQSLGEEIHRGSVQANDFAKGEGNDAEQLARSTPSTSTQRPERRISTGSINTNVLLTGPNANIDKSGSTNIVGAVTSEEGQEPNTDRMKTKAQESVGTKYAVGGTTDSKDESPSTSVQSLGEEIHRGSIQANDIVKSEGDDAEELGGSTPSTSTQRPERRNSTESDISKGEGQHVMLSYSWAQKEIVLKVKDGLEKFGYRIWIDREKMTGSLLDSMANAVEDSAIVLMCVSKTYKDSGNCKSEAEYTRKLKKPFIPLLVEEGYNADGWLGFLLGEKLYFDFSDIENFESKLAELDTEIKRTISTIKRNKTSSLPTIKASTPTGNQTESLQAKKEVKGASGGEEKSLPTTLSPTERRGESANSAGPSSDNAAGATSIHYHVDVAHITGNVVALGDNSYIEQSGTNVVGTVGSGPREEKERDKKLTKEKVDPGEREESGKNFEQTKKIEKREEPVKKVVVIPGGPYTSGGSSIHRFFRAGAYAQKFREIVNKRSYKQALGGITDTFKEQKLHEPGFEANPRMKKLTHFYSGELAPKTSDYTKEPILNVSTGSAEESDFISPEKLIDLISNRNSKYIAIAGKAGSGKTTLIRRLTRDIISINKLDNKATIGGFFTSIFSKPRFKMVHFLNVKDIEDGSKPMTPRELLFDRVFPDMNENELRYGYDRMVNNQNEVLLVFDGLDQAQWIIQENYPKVNHMDQASTAATMTSILSGHLFPDVQIIISSREHSLSPLTGKLRPNCIIAMMGLKLEDIEKVFNAVLSYDGESTDEFISLNPAILPLCSIPLFLMYCAVIRRIYPKNLPSTMTEVMKLILQIFMRFEHARQSYDSKIINSLKRVSFIAHLEKRVTFTTVELEKHGLLLKMIRDFMINVPGSPMLNQKLFDGDFRVFFSHQTLQEKFTAMYVCDKEVEDFRSFAWEELRQPHWSVVRRFVCGMLAHTRDHELEFFKIEQKTEKWAIFKEILVNQAENVENPLDRPEMFALLYESQDEDLIQSIIREIDFVGETFTPASIHAISSTIRCCRHLKLFRLSCCVLNKELFDIFERTTRGLQIEIDTVFIETIAGISITELVNVLRRFSCKLLVVFWREAIDADQDSQSGMPDLPNFLAVKTARNGAKMYLGSPTSVSNDATRSNQIPSELQEILQTVKTVNVTEGRKMQGDLDVLESSVSQYQWEEMSIQDVHQDRILHVNKNKTFLRNHGFVVFGFAAAQCKVQMALMGECQLRRNDVDDFIKGVGNTKIRMMDVSRNATLRENGGFATFGSVVKQCTVQEVSIQLCKLKRYDVEGFLKGAENSKIRMLNVSHNSTLRENGGFATFGSVVKQCTVQEVSMRHCKLKRDDVEGFLKGAENSKIRRLDLSWNGLEEGGGLAYVGSVVVQCGVQELIMQHYDLTAEILRDFQSTAGNVKIRLVDLSSHDPYRRTRGLTQEVFNEILRIVRRNKVETLIMNECRCNRDAFESFKKSITSDVDFQYSLE